MISRTIHKLRSPVWIPGLLLAFALVRCADSGNTGDAPAGGGGTGGRSLGVNPDLELSFGEPKGNTSDDDLNALCGGDKSDCVPDDPASCLNLGGMGGAIEAVSPGGAAGGVSYEPGDLGVIGLACRVTSSECGAERCPPTRQCRSAGAVREGQPCVSATDCAAGLACVGEGAAGVCRGYCCAGTSASCSDDTFCDVRPLLNNPELYVPVCLPVDNCPLTDPFPCPNGDCFCQASKACIVVRHDGATACTEPGAGRAGDPCTSENADDCAHGFVCSPTAGCMQLCSTVAEESTCPAPGTCQSPPEFPKTLGLCVGLAGDSTAAR